MPIDDNKKPAHPLWAGFPQKHEGTCYDICQYAYEGCAGQRHVLLLPRGFTDERLLHYCPALHRRLHRCQRPCSVCTTQVNHHSHQGG